MRTEIMQLCVHILKHLGLLSGQAAISANVPMWGSLEPMIMDSYDLNNPGTLASGIFIQCRI